MTDQAKRAQILQITFAAALGDGKDVISIPESLTSAFADSPVCAKPDSVCTARTAQRPEFFYGVDTADGADSLVTKEDLIAKIRRLGSELPLVDAGFRAKGKTPLRYLDRAPAA